jgi:hypothetical protein
LTSQFFLLGFFATQDWTTKSVFNRRVLDYKDCCLTTERKMQPSLCAKQRQETLDLPYLTLLCDNLKNRMFLQNSKTCLQLFIFLQFSTLTFIEIYRFIVHHFSKKTINFVFIVLSIFFEKDTLYCQANCNLCNHIIT